MDPTFEDLIPVPQTSGPTGGDLDFRDLIPDPRAPWSPPSVAGTGSQFAPASLGLPVRAPTLWPQQMASSPQGAPGASSPPSRASDLAMLLRAASGEGPYPAIGSVSPAAEQLAAALAGTSGGGALAPAKADFGVPERPPQGAHVLEASLEPKFEAPSSAPGAVLNYSPIPGSRLANTLSRLRSLRELRSPLAQASADSVRQVSRASPDRSPRDQPGDWLGPNGQAGQLGAWLGHQVEDWFGAASNAHPDALQAAPHAPAVPPQASRSAAASSLNGGQAFPLSPQGVAWLQDVEKNSVDLTPQTAAQLHEHHFDDASKTYVDSTGNLTFGYGHVITPADQARGLTKQNLANMSAADKQALADHLWKQDVIEKYKSIVDLLGADTVARLSPGQRDALIGTVFNAGAGRSALGPHMRQAIWDHDYAKAGNEFNAWFGHVTGEKQEQVIPGLVRRNLEEQAIWGSGDYHRIKARTDPRVTQIVARGGR